MGINVPYFSLIGLTPFHEFHETKLCQRLVRGRRASDVGGSLVKLGVFHKRAANLDARLLDRREWCVISLGVVKKGGSTDVALGWDGSLGNAR